MLVRQGHALDYWQRYEARRQLYKAVITTSRVSVLAVISTTPSAGAATATLYGCSVPRGACCELPRIVVLLYYYYSYYYSSTIRTTIVDHKKEAQTLKVTAVRLRGFHEAGSICRFRV